MPFPQITVDTSKLNAIEAVAVNAALDVLVQHPELVTAVVQKLTIAVLTCVKDQLPLQASARNLKGTLLKADP